MAGPPCHLLTVPSISCPVRPMMMAPDIVRRVWGRWTELPDDCPAPVKTVARDLKMPTDVVAAIVYPAVTFGEWSDEQEPAL